jgi:hypothetical protein
LTIINKKHGCLVTPNQLFDLRHYRNKRQVPTAVFGLVLRLAFIRMATVCLLLVPAGASLMFMAGII